MVTTLIVGTTLLTRTALILRPATLTNDKEMKERKFSIVKIRVGNLESR
jgi:hypothetical protein